MPAVRRAEEFEKKYSPPTAISGPSEPVNARPGNRREPGGPPDYEPGTPGHRRQIVEMAFMGVMGMSRKAAEAKYDQQLQQWYAEQGIEPPRKTGRTRKT